LSHGVAALWVSKEWLFSYTDNSKGYVLRYRYVVIPLMVERLRLGPITNRLREYGRHYSKVL